MSSESTKPRIRILAYIERRFMFGSPGFVLDISIEVASVIDGQETWALIQHYGDGQFYERFETAADVVLRESGLKMELIPEEEQGLLESGGQLASACVFEFEATSKPRAKVEEESLYLGFLRALADSRRSEHGNRN